MRIAPLLACSAALLLSPAFAGDKVEYGPVPAWVKPVARPVNDDTMSQAPIKSMLQVMQFRFAATGSESYTETFTRVQTPQGLTALGNFSLPWRPDSDVLTVHRFQLLRGEQVIDILAAGQTFEILRRENNLERAALDGILTATIQPHGMEVGDVLNVAFTVRRESKLLPEPEMFVSGLNDMPLSSVELRATWDRGLPMHWRATEQVKGIKESRRGDLVEVNWTANNLAPIAQPKDVPWRFWQEPRIVFSSYRTWNEVSKKLGPLYARAATLAADSPLKAEARAIANASADTATRLEAVLRLAQDRVRYVFLGMNEGGFNPASADETWTRRFGDCKAKSTLILAMLHELDIEAEPVAVNTYAGDLVAGGLPSIGAFNHVIIRARAGNQTWWLDGASSGSWRSADMVMPNYTSGLPLTVRGDALLRMVAGPAAEPLSETNTVLDARAGLYTDVPFKAETRIRGGSGAALHTQLSGLMPADMERGLREFWKKEYDFVKVKTVAARFDEKAGVEILSMEGTADMDWAGNSYTTDGLYVGYRADFKRDGDINVDAPFTLPHPLSRRITQRIELPATGNFTMRGKDYDTVVAGMQYVRSSKLENRVFTGETTARSMAPEVPAAEARAAEKALNDMWRDDIEIVVQDYYSTDADVAALRTRDFDDGPNLRWRGGILLNRRDLDGAIADFDKALQLNDKDYAALAERGIARYWKRDYELAESDFEAVLAKQPANAVALRGLGAVLNEKKQYPEAIARFTESLKFDPGNTFALSHRAYAHRNAGDNDKALADAAEALRADPSYLDMYTIRAGMLDEGDDKTLVEAEIDAMLKALPKNADAWMGAAWYYDRGGRRAEAMAAADRAIAIDPQPGFYLTRASMRDPKDIAARMADVETALEKDPALPGARTMRAWLQSLSGDHAAAIATYSELLKTATRIHQKRGLWSLRGIEYVKSGQSAKAEKDFAAALADDPESDAYNEFCWNLALANVNLDAALAACEKAVRLYPKDARYLDSKGLALLQLGRLDESIAAYDAALELLPKQPASLFARGVAKNRNCKCDAGNADIGEARRIDATVERWFEGSLDIQ